MTTSWYEPLRALRSLGSQSERPGSLAGLAKARERNLGQFFTPDELSRFVWDLGVTGPAHGLQRRVSVLDNSVGTARLLQFADTEQHYIAGCDVHEPTIDALMDAADAAGLKADFVHAGMQAIRPQQFDVALINPPFSIHLDAPMLEPYSCTGWGSYGPNTGAVSHAYAVHQALDAAEVVVAILPSTYAQTVLQSPTPEMAGRLRALVQLPRGSFREENTQVDVSLLVFGPFNGKDAPARVALDVLDPAALPDLDLQLPVRGAAPRPLSPTTQDASEPAIRGPVTGDRTVRIVHNGRRIHFKFGCALTEAKVLNHVLTEPVMPMEGHRYPAGVRFIGQGKLDVEVMLLQDNPLGCLHALAGMVRDAGGEPQVCPGLTNYLRRRTRRFKRESAPFGHVVQGGVDTGSDTGAVTAKRRRLLDPSQWGSPLLKAGDVVELELLDQGDYRISSGKHSVTIREDELIADFNIPRAAANDDQWREASPSRTKLFPQLARALSCQLEASGAAAVAGWDYQLEDMIELSMGRHGIATWRMGCGKGRLAIAMALAGGRHNAIVVEAHLIDELVDQLRESGVDESLWQVITTASQCSNLRKINLISYNRMRMGVCDGAGRRTFARLLRRRFCRVVADEAHLLRNTETAQTRALFQLSPRRRLAMTGTPIANYVQNLLPLAQWAYGDGTAVQPFGRYRAHLEPRLWTSMSAAKRGVEAFAERHVVTEWVTREWQDGMQVGAKRQVPKISRIELLRDWAAPLLKRRHETEPMVAAHFSVPTPEIRLTELDWSDDHLSHYLTVADEFANWYRDAYGDGQKNINLITLLARIGAVERACNTPQYISKSKAGSRIPAFCGLTSKQRHVLARLKEWTNQGHKSVCYVDSPTAVRLYVAELAKMGIEAVPFDGELGIKKRTRDMNLRFRRGDAPVLVASIQTIQNGLNLWQANRGIIAARSWTHTMEEQMMRRLLRPQQKRDVLFELVNLRGSIDDYQHQMTLMKGDTAAAAMDFLTPSTDDMEFVHLDQILSRFVQDLAERSGLDAHKLREQLKAA
ncbi:MAG: SNF2-related protein [Pseudomonas sp.]